MTFIDATSERAWAEADATFNFRPLPEFGEQRLSLPQVAPSVTTAPPSKGKLLRACIERTCAQALNHILMEC